MTLKSGGAKVNPYMPRESGILVSGAKSNWNLSAREAKYKNDIMRANASPKQPRLPEKILEFSSINYTQ